MKLVGGGGYWNGLVCPDTLLSIHHTFVVSANFWINCVGDWSQTWWMHSLWYSSGLVIFCSGFKEFQLFPGLWFVEQFMYIWRQTADQIELKIIKQIYKGPPLAWITFGHAQLNSSADLSGFVVIMHSSLCEKYIQWPMGFGLPLCACRCALWQQTPTDTVLTLYVLNFSRET